MKQIEEHEKCTMCDKNAKTRYRYRGDIICYYRCDFHVTRWKAIAETLAYLEYSAEGFKKARK